MKTKNTKTIAYRVIALIIGAVCLACTFLPAASAVTTVNAYPTGSVRESGVYLNGEMIVCSAYNIGGANYFKLRDIMQELDVSVIYDGKSQTIYVDTTKPYVPDGTETTQQIATNKARGYATEFFPTTATVTTASVKLNGETVYWDAYNIGGSNHFKLRDIGEALDISVEWEEVSRLVQIDTSRGYGVEASKPGSNGKPTDEEIEAMKLEVVRLTNIERVKAGLSEVEILPELMNCAQAKADDMNNNNYFGHNSPVYGTPIEMMRIFAPNIGTRGENLVHSEKPKDAVAAWMRSDEHRKAMLDVYSTHVGVGIVYKLEVGPYNSYDTFIYVQLFGYNPTF